VELGVCIASHINDIDYAVAAEQLGYSHAWFADSQMLWSDCYACLALAAVKTSTIQLGTGVAIAGTRPPAVNAAAIATINALAPGRTFFGVGAGNTATRTMGLPPLRIKAFAEYLAQVLPLIRGDEAMMPHRGRQIPIKQLMPETGFVNFSAPIPAYISGFGPKSLGLAGQYGDGAVLAMPTSVDVMQLFWRWIEAGAKASGRVIDRNQFHTTALTTIVLLQPGEQLTSRRIKEQCGAMAMASVHFAYDQWRNFNKPPPVPFQGIWEDYCALLESYPEYRRHQRIHAGHNCWVLPEEEHFLTAEVIAASCLVGTPDAVHDQLAALAEVGLKQVMILPSFEPRYQVLKEVAKLLPGLG